MSYDLWFKRAFLKELLLFSVPLELYALLKSILSLLEVLLNSIIEALEMVF
jgi:hypothetical protein